MHDLRAIRDNPEAFDAGLKKRGLLLRAEEVLALDRAWRLAETMLQEAQALANRLAREIGMAKKSGGDISELMHQSAENRNIEASALAVAAEARRQIDQLLATLPTYLRPMCQRVWTKTANKLIRTVGTPPRFNFAPLPHEAIGDKLGVMDLLVRRGCRGRGSSC